MDSSPTHFEIDPRVALFLSKKEFVTPLLLCTVRFYSSGYETGWEGRCRVTVASLLAQAGGVYPIPKLEMMERREHPQPIFLRHHTRVIYPGSVG